MIKILQNQTYIGDLVQGKKKSENYRTHKLVDTKKEDWVIVENHHDVVVPKEDVEKELKRKSKNLKEFNREILFEFVNNIIINDNGSIEIKYKIRKWYKSMAKKKVTRDVDPVVYSHIIKHQPKYWKINIYKNRFLLIYEKLQVFDNVVSEKIFGGYYG